VKYTSFPYLSGAKLKEDKGPSGKAPKPET